MNILFNMIFWVIILSGLYLYINKTEDNKTTIKILIGIILLRLIFANLKYFLGLPPKFPDSDYYREAINNIVNSGMNFSVFKDRIDVQTYVWVYALIQFLSGNIYITIININSILGSLAIYNAGKIARKIKDVKAQNITMLLLLIYPSFILYTNDNLREGPVLFFITLAMYKLVKYIKDKEQKDLLIYIILLPPIYVLRVVNVIPMAIFGVLSFIIVNRKKINIKLLLLISFVLSTLAIIFVYKTTNIRIDLNYINQTLNRDRFDSMAYLVGLRYDNWIELILYIPVRLFYFMFHPFPWIPSSYKYLTVTVSSIFEFITVVMILVLLFTKREKKIDNKFILYTFLTFIIMALTIYAVVKTEAAARHRLQYMWGLPTVLGILISNKIEINKLKLKK